MDAPARPGVVFRDGPSGRRAALRSGPDVWEVVAATHHSVASGETAVTATAAEMSLSVAQVRTALDCYERHRAEIDEQISENERAADEAYTAWLADG